MANQLTSTLATANHIVTPKKPNGSVHATLSAAATPDQQ